MIRIPLKESGSGGRDHFEGRVINILAPNVTYDPFFSHSDTQSQTHYSQNPLPA